MGLDSKRDTLSLSRQFRTNIFFSTECICQPKSGFKYHKFRPGYRVFFHAGMSASLRSLCVPLRLLNAEACGPSTLRRCFCTQAELPFLNHFHEIETLSEGIISGDRLAVSRGITLTESLRPDHQLLAAALLRALQKMKRTATGSAFRIGVSGPPGAGKSTLIETLGSALIEKGLPTAVLAIDPSSQVSGGAILGDKTRMPMLSNSEDAFVRPTPARGTLGGVARATNDAILIAEAAGYQRVLVETVGVGQSETAVADLVDCVLLVAPPVGGDELQVIKRGIMEISDIIAVNKADGETLLAARRAAAHFRGTLHFHRQRRRSWSPVVLTCSAKSGEGIDELVSTLDRFLQALTASGELLAMRREQRKKITWAATEEAVLESLRNSPAVLKLMSQVLPDVASGEMAPRIAAEVLASRHAEYD